MKKLLIHLFVQVIAGSPLLAQGSNSASQSLLLEVRPITKITVSGNPGALIVTEAIAGSQLSSVADNSTQYSVTTNLESMKIVASINQQMPAGTRLKLQLGSNKGVSVGTVDLSNALTPVDVVCGIGKGTEAGQPISYVFEADATMGQLSSSSRTITLTLTN